MKIFLAEVSWQSILAVEPRMLFESFQSINRTEYCSITSSKIQVPVVKGYPQICEQETLCNNISHAYWLVAVHMQWHTPGTRSKTVPLPPDHLISISICSLNANQVHQSLQSLQVPPLRNSMLHINALTGEPFNGACHFQLSSRILPHTRCLPSDQWTQLAVIVVLKWQSDTKTSKCLACVSWSICVYLSLIVPKNLLLNDIMPTVSVHMLFTCHKS